MTREQSLDEESDLLVRSIHMTAVDWNELRYFHIDERTPWGTPAWGNPLKVNLYLMLQMEALREYLKKPIRIHCAWELEGHEDNSYHTRDGICRAVDWSCAGVDLEELFLACTKFDFIGIGKYEFWNTPGMHTDVRPRSRLKPRTYWYRDSTGHYVYY